MKKKILISFVLFLYLLSPLFSQAIIIDHTCCDLSKIDSVAIENAKDSLHIAYGHTSHGSQVTTGMAGLDGQDSLIGYKGDIYEWNEGGTGGALDIDDYFGSGDLGHNGDTSWAPPTRTYLATHTDVNVVMYSWCGGCSDNTVAGINTYLSKMTDLENDYPNVTFIYMTGHRDIWSDDTLKRNNQLIRDYCIANNKILYDFADIESYDPDSVYYEWVNDNCNYYDSNYTYQGNWATEWQNTHQEGIYWYDCSSAHSEPLNANLKAYAAWWMWCRISGWAGPSSVDENNNSIAPDNYYLSHNYSNPFNPIIKIEYSISVASFVKIEVFNSAGMKIETLVDSQNNAGVYSVDFNVEDLSSEVYFYRITTDNFIKTNKLILIK